MRVFFSDQHALHVPRYGLSAEGRVSPPDVPARVDAIRATLTRSARCDAVRAGRLPDGALQRVHDRGYLDFLRTAYERWIAAGETSSGVLPDLFAGRTAHRPGRHPSNLAGWFCFDAFTPITKGTYVAACAAAACAVAAAEAVVAGERCAYGLCRPPGHHAGRDFYGGYCYLNSAAIALETVRPRLGAAARAAILDLDAHHGNGTQQIYYRDGRVLCVSLHADPADDYPYYWGYADERGEGPGEGFNVNLPLALSTGEMAYGDALRKALAVIEDFGPDLLFVSLGCDALVTDPIGGLGLEPDGFGRLGEQVAALRRPTVVLQEGGYDLERLGDAVAAFLAPLA